MSKTRTKSPNNTTSRIAPRMVWPASNGTYSVGNNAKKRRRRELGKQWRAGA